MAPSCSSAANVCAASRVVQVSANDDAARVKIVVERLRLAQELGAENDVVAMILFADSCRKSNRNRRLDNHDGVGVILHNHFNDRFDCRSIKEVLLAVIVGRRRDNNKISISVCCFCI